MASLHLFPPSEQLDRVLDSLLHLRIHPFVLSPQSSYPHIREAAPHLRNNDLGRLTSFPRSLLLISQRSQNGAWYQIWHCGPHSFIAINATAHTIPPQGPMPISHCVCVWTLNQHACDLFFGSCVRIALHLRNLHVAFQASSAKSKFSALPSELTLLLGSY